MAGALDFAGDRSTSVTADRRTIVVGLHQEDDKKAPPAVMVDLMGEIIAGARRNSEAWRRVEWAVPSRA